ncbi:hypothetical protein F7734_44115 [Scytonema sp. UIC 10036]|uniref:hypothetical protein n=1 Tax=Scytonema sp. UIC 10036 TaxID=2304196 RepID=UPI0012DA8939|nr:hypothetical protein [Scytonema sp. UIC 10036]MUG98912.1 hypothetical protein [Scytonema sp. UIC 10036]
MFAQKVQSIESQIQQLTEQLNSYRSLESELEQALLAIARIKATAAELGVTDEVEASLGLSSDVALKEKEYKAMLKNRDLRIERLEQAYTDVATEREQQKDTIRQLEEKLEAQQKTGWVNLVEPEEEWGEEDEEENLETKTAEHLETKTPISEEEARKSLFPEPVQLGLPTIEVGSIVECPDGVTALSRDPCKIMQDGLESLYLSSFQAFSQILCYVKLCKHTVDI